MKPYTVPLSHSRLRILPALLVGSGLKLVQTSFSFLTGYDSPGFISREWIETVPAMILHPLISILPALLVGSGLKHSNAQVWRQRTHILPALLVGSGLKPESPAVKLRTRDSPGFISREWIETMVLAPFEKSLADSPGFISREWIETPGEYPNSVQVDDSPGFISREWIETGVCHVTPSGDEMILPALLVGSGLKPRQAGLFGTRLQHSPGFISREWIETP